MITATNTKTGKVHAVANRRVVCLRTPTHSWVLNETPWDEGAPGRTRCTECRRIHPPAVAANQEVNAA